MLSNAEQQMLSNAKQHCMHNIADHHNNAHKETKTFTPYILFQSNQCELNFSQDLNPHQVKFDR